MDLVNLANTKLIVTVTGFVVESTYSQEDVNAEYEHKDAVVKECSLICGHNPAWLADMDYSEDNNTNRKETIHHYEKERDKDTQGTIERGRFDDENVGKDQKKWEHSDSNTTVKGDQEIQESCLHYLFHGHQGN